MSSICRRKSGRDACPAWAAILLLAVAPVAFAGTIAWKGGTAQTLERTPAEVAAAINGLAPAGAGTHFVVQFNGPVSKEDKAAVESAGVQLLSYLSENAFFAKSAMGGVDVAALSNVASLAAAEPIQLNWKLHPFLAGGNVPTWAVVDAKAAAEPGPRSEGEDQKGEGALPADPIVGAYVIFHPDVQLVPDAVNIALRHQAVVRDQLMSIKALIVELPLSQIRPLAAEDAVQYVEPPLPKFSVNNNSNRARTGADIVQAFPYGLNGAGVSVMVYDGGTARVSHADFGGRARNGDTAPLSDHTTHVSGTIGGSGQASSGTYRGMAPAVDLEVYGFEYDGTGTFLYTNPGDLEADYNDAINNHGADVSNNSIGTNTAPNGFPCEFEGDYGLCSMLIDSVVRGSLGAPFRVVWANGNERQGSARCGSTYHTTAPPACAKNHITVGAMNSNDDSVTSFTSWGPADDGRMKPDISAPGCQSDDDNGVTSCSSSSDTGYGVKCGTSMASPTVCGLSALLLQDFRQQFPGEPDFRNSTLKTLLAHNAVDLGNVGPDYQTGYGSVRIQPTIDFMRTGNFLEAEVDQGTTYSVLVVVNPGDLTLKVTLAWDDVPGSVNVIPELVNDLDLVVFDPSATQHFPWTLDPANPANPAVQTQADHLNNLEQVFVANPTPGAWRVEIHGTNVPQGPQPFSLCASPLLVNCSTQGVISLDRAKYPCTGAATIQVVDCDLNTDDMVVETVAVSIASTSEPGGESVVLTETGAETAAFRGTIAIDAANAAGVLLVAGGDTITATYIDADDGIGGTNVTVTAMAPVDCTPPVISNVQATNVAPRSATVEFTTDEPAQATVHYGLSCGALTDTMQVAGFRTAHAANLSGLTDNTTYFYSVEAEDQAGNASADDNGGSCYTFATPEIPDYFTELFAGDNDLDNLSLLFAPNGTFEYYTACAVPIGALPTDPAGGTNLTLSDDGSSTVNLGGGATVSLYGVSYGAIYVNANGNVSFTSADGTYTETLAAHFNQPRISALFDDLNPATGGTVSWKQLADRVAVTWLGVPEYSTTNSNTCQIEMFFDGVIQVSFLNIDATDGVAGLSAGGGLPVDFFESDLSAAGSCGPRPPGAQNASYTTGEGTPLNIVLNASDDGLPDPPGALTYIILSLPTKGTLADAGAGAIGAVPYTLVGNGDEVVYSPNPGEAGPDSFTFKVNDGGVPPDGGDSNTATISINIEPILTLPFSDQFPTTTFDSLKWSEVLNATISNLALNPPSAPNAARFNGDPNGGDRITTHLINLASAGAVRLNYSYEQTGGGESPDAADDLFVEYFASDQTWKALRQHLGSGPDMTTFQTEELLLPGDALHANFRLRIRNTATAGAFDDWFVDNVSLTIANAPQADSGSVTTPANTIVNVTLSASDPNGDTLDYIIESLPAHGTLRDPETGATFAAPYTLLSHGNVVRYRPNPGYQGLDSFTFKATDGTYDSNTASISITVGGPQLVHSFPMNADPGWTTTGQWAFGVPTGGGSHNLDPAGGYTGSNVYGYNLSGDYPNNLSPVMYLTTTAIDCSSLTGAQLRFRRWLGIESATYDHANVQVSNNGTSWTSIWDHTGAALSESAWSLQSYDISAVADGQATVYVRWGMGTTDVSVTYPGWNIDDVEIWALIPASLPGDCDDDGDIDLNDFADFDGCYQGPGVAVGPGCECADTDGDNDVDLVDFALVLELFTVP